MPGPMMGDTPSGVVARRMWPSRVASCWAVDAELGTLVARAKVGCGSVKKGQVGGAVAGSRRLWWGGAGLAVFLAACAFFDVVVDVPRSWSHF